MTPDATNASSPAQAQLPRCEWCGETAPLIEDTAIWGVQQYDDGAFHAPCRESYGGGALSTMTKTRLTLDEQIGALQAAYDTACADTAAEQGEEIVDTGGWVELARATVDLAPPGITGEAKREFLRMNGLGR